MANIPLKTRVVTGIAPDALPYDEMMMAAQTPVIFKGAASDWPLVRAGLQSVSDACDYIRPFDKGRPVLVYRGAPQIAGRFGYDASMTGLNFSAERMSLGTCLDAILGEIDNPHPPSFYLGSTDIDLFVPGLQDDNRLILNHDMFRLNPPLATMWIGNQTTATAHFDMSHNIAVCVAGHRRFTLFPPDQIANLYPGPLEPTPGGQVVSTVDFITPDYDRHPRFKEAEAAGQVADMEPGDVLFYPALWWHHVEALDPFNILINYWWNTSPNFMDTPWNTLLHGILSLRDRPDAEKASWRALFDYYVFGPAEQAYGHLPEPARGALGPLDDLKARRLRASLLSRLNR